MKFNKSIIGMIHLSGVNMMQPMPSQYRQDPVERALKEIEIYERCGLQGIIVENYHGSVDQVIEVLKRVKTTMDIGVNILPNEYADAFEIADKYGAKFIQLDFISGKYERNKEIDVTDYLEYRNRYSNISVLGGVWPKYYVPVKGSDLERDIVNAKSMCDAVVVTGSGTGKETPFDKIKFFRDKLGNFPLIIGAGMTVDNISQLKIADGAIVGSYFKPNSNTGMMVDEVLVSNFMNKVNVI